MGAPAYPVGRSERAAHTARSCARGGARGRRRKGVRGRLGARRRDAEGTIVYTECADQSLVGQVNPSADRRAMRLAIWRSDRDGLRCAHARACMRACVRACVRACFGWAPTCAPAPCRHVSLCEARPRASLRGPPGTSWRRNRSDRGSLRAQSPEVSTRLPLAGGSAGMREASACDCRKRGRGRAPRSAAAIPTMPKCAAHGTARLSQRDCRLLSVSVSWFRRGTAGSQLPRA